MCEIKKKVVIPAISAIIISTFVFSGCRKKASEEIGFGSMDGSVYANEYFELTIELPTDWTLQDSEDQKQLMDVGAKVVAGDDKNMNAIFKATEMQTVNLFMASKHPVGTPISFNPSIIGLAEKVSHMPGIKRGKDYHFHTKRLMESSSLEVSFPEEIYTEELGGYLFDVMSVEMKMSGVLVKQKQYVTVLKGYALDFCISYCNEEEEGALKDILKTIQKGD
jgi:hypothetical protein